MLAAIDFYFTKQSIMVPIKTQCVLDKAFYRQPTLKVAKSLPGKILCRDFHGAKLRYRITEVEAYDGFEDKASHAHRGKTPRNAVMFGPGGYWYVYLCYGVHWMLNIVTGEEGYPAAVLIRGTEVVAGPGRLTKAMQIDKNLDGRYADRDSGLWIEDDGFCFKKTQIIRTPRIGIDYAGPYWSQRLYRFCLNVSPR